MSSPSDLPPNPREAKRRQVPLHWGAYPVTAVLVAICVLVAVVSSIGKDKRLISAFFFAQPATEQSLEALWNDMAVQMERRGEMGGAANATNYEERLKEEFDRRLRRNNFAQISSGEVWRLFTPMFIHFGLLHLVFNLMWVWDLGRVLESRFRGTRFLLLVLGVSLVANLCQALASGPNFGGMSGVVYGLFGFVLLRQKFHPAGDVRLNPQTVPWMLIWLVVCFTGQVGPVANAAHVGGLVAGCVLGFGNAMLGGGWGLLKRRREFQRAVSRSDDSLHRCAVCGLTERDDADMEFRVGADGEEYCMEHLPRA